MLWVSADAVVEDLGPLLRAALPAEEPGQELAAAAAEDTPAAAAAGAAAAAANAEAEAAALLAAVAAAAEDTSAAAADAARLQALFSMCISAVKLLREQTRGRSPYAPAAAGQQSPAAVLEQIQQAAAAILQSHTGSSTAVCPNDGMQMQPGTTHGGANAGDVLLLPWAVLVLRCVQLSTGWMQQTAAGLKASSSSSSSNSSSSSMPSAAPDQVGGAAAPATWQQLKRLVELASPWGRFVMGCRSCPVHLTSGVPCQAPAKALAAAATVPGAAAAGAAAISVCCAES
uniref:Uncharacterized protein n=1 Tax=Tetradesmus obliquus TaxID=3088 RepID=A0A383WJ02_TETOB|eukprot:jgi/Sobl393_1/17883/SZX77438.1